MTKAFHQIIATALAALLCVASQANAQEEDWLRWCGGDFDLCGYYDRETNAEIIPPIYDRAFSFSEGLAAVRYQGQYGYINPQGEMVIAPQFDLAGEFRFGMTEILLGDHVGIIDSTGAFKIEPQYARAIPVSRSAVLIEAGSWGETYRGRSGRLDYDWTGMYRADSVLNNFRNWSVAPGSNLHFATFDPNGGDLIWAGIELRSNQTIRYGLLSLRTGYWWTLPEYALVSRLSEGLANVRTADGRMLFVDQEGVVQFEAPYRYAHDFRDGFALVVETHDDRPTTYGVLDKTGTLVGNRLYPEVREPSPRNTWQVLSDGAWLEVAPDSSLSIAAPLPPRPPRPVSPIPRLLHENRATANCANGVSIFNDGDRSKSNYGMVSADGTVLIEPAYDALSCYGDGVAWAANFGDGEWCPVGPDGVRAPYPACQTTYNPIFMSHASPEPMDSDPFTSSVKWMQAFLEFECGGSTAVPLFRSDGSQNTIPTVDCDGLFPP